MALAPADASGRASARTGAAASGVIDLASGLVGWWKLDDGRGPVARGSSKKSGHGMIGGAKWTAGQAGGALFFDGDDSHVEIPNSPSLENVQEGDYALAAWVKPNLTPSGAQQGANKEFYGVLLKRPSSMGLAYSGGSRFVLQHVLAGSVCTTLDTFGSFPHGSFRHVAGVGRSSQGEAEIYVNGRREGTISFAPGAQALEFGKEPWRAGAPAPGEAACHRLMDGVIDDVRVYACALSAEEIEALVGAQGRQVSRMSEARRGATRLAPARAVR